MKKIFTVLFLVSSFTFGQLYISEVSEGGHTSTEFLEIYNSGSSAVNITGYKLVRVKVADNLKEFVFDIGTDGTPGDNIIPAGGFWIITRGADRATFESDFPSFPISAKFYQGTKSLYFATNTIRRWRLRANDGTVNKDDGTLLDDTDGAAGGAGNRTIQNPINTFTTSGSSGGRNSTPGELDPSQTLPVELTTFSASVVGNNVTLNWETATEVNNYGFNVERKSETGDWNEITFINGHGNSNSPQNYSYIDASVISGIYSYRLKQIDVDGAFEYSDVVEITMLTSVEFSLSQNFPNPFNPTTTISFSIPPSDVRQDLSVRLTVFNVIGEQVADLVNENLESGNYSVKFDGSELNSGIYIYKLEAQSFVQIRKMMLVK